MNTEEDLMISSFMTAQFKGFGKQFCKYKLVPSSNGKNRKVPCDLAGNPIDCFRPENFVSFDMTPPTCVGLCFTNSNVIGLDFDDVINEDNCNNATGEPVYKDDSIQRWINYFDSYTEISSSGRGLHILIEVPDLPKEYKSYYKVNEHIQVFCNYGYFALTFNYIFEKYEIKKCSFDSFLMLCKEHNNKETKEKKQVVTNQKTESTEDDAALLSRILKGNKGNKVKNLWLCTCLKDVNALGYPSCSEADMALASELVFWADVETTVRLLKESCLWAREKNKHGEDYLLTTVQNAMRTKKNERES